MMDIKHYFIEKGKGEPLILLHGNGEDCSYFHEQIDEFSKLFHVYAIDTRGYGNAEGTAVSFETTDLDGNKIDKDQLLLI